MNFAKVGQVISFTPHCNVNRIMLSVCGDLFLLIIFSILELFFIYLSSGVPCKEGICPSGFGSSQRPCWGKENCQSGRFWPDSSRVWRESLPCKEKQKTAIKMDVNWSHLWSNFYSTEWRVSGKTLVGLEDKPIDLVWWIYLCSNVSLRPWPQ